MPDKIPSLLARGLSKSYPGTERALDGVDFSLESGGIAALVGANGSGKTTLLKILAGRSRGSAGSVRIFGRDAADPELRTRIGYVSQDPALDPEMTGRAMAIFFARLRGLPDPAGTASALLETFGLASKADSPLSSYSGGMRQRQHILLELLHDPELLLMDEASAGLDPDGREMLWRFLRDFSARGGTVLLSTHDLHEASRYCSRVLFMAGGRIMAEGSPEDLIANHGSWLWEGSFAPSRSAGAREALEESLGGVAWLRSHELRPGTLTLWMKDGAPEDPEILALVRGAGLDIEAYRRRRPDLASAYHELTGKTLTGNPGEKKARRAGSRNVF